MRQAHSRFDRHVERTTAAAGPQPRWEFTRVCLLIALAAAPLPLLAQRGPAGGKGFLFERPKVSVTLRGGYDAPTARSEIFDFTIDQLTLSRRDFAAGNISLDVGVRLRERLDLVLGTGQSRRTAGSEFRRFVDDDDLPIEQVTRLRRRPLTVGLQTALTAPGERIGRLAWIPSRITPWVGAGGGAMFYEFLQEGDFVEAATLDVFADRLSSQGVAPMAYANVGLDIRVATRLFLTTDVRYSAARARLSGSFERFDRIDLSGTAATLGLTFRL